MTIPQIDTDLLTAAYTTLNQAFADLSGGAGFEGPGADAELSVSAQDALQATAIRLQDNYPYHHPNYAGQMLKPPHPIAQLAYTLAQSINPNNHALDGGRASSAMEKEAVAHIAAMFGWQEQHLGHLCSGGTVANLEALWVAREQTNPGAKLVSSEFSHYTHSRLSGVLGMAHSSVAADQYGRMDINALRQTLDQFDVGTVVATLGTTSFGSIDPLVEIVALKKEYGFRLHVDAAYGGYFKLLPELPGARDFAALFEVDSIVIDPHKHGLQPYGCGCVLFANPKDGTVYAHESPYTYFTSEELHLGEISLECSRPGAAAVALWATQKMLPNVTDGNFASDLRQSREAAVRLHAMLQASERWQPLLTPDLDVVVWVAHSKSISEASRRSRSLFEALAKRDIHIALLKVDASFAATCGLELHEDSDTLTCLRVSLMKPEHNAWLSSFVEQLDALSDSVLQE